MAYSRPMYKRRAPARKYQTGKSKSIYTKKVKSAKYALPALARQVSVLKRKVAGTTSEVQYGVSVNNPIGNVAGDNIYILPLSQYSGWSRIFGTDADDESNHRALWKKTNLDIQIFTNGERNLVDYTMMIVSLTKAGQEELFTQATGGLAGPLGITTLANGTHYFRGATQGMSFVNRRYFNIHFCKRMRTGSPGNLATDTNDLSKRVYVKLNHNSGKGFVITNPKGDWKANASPQVASQNLYVLLFNNDSTADASAYFQMTGIHTLQIA